MVYWAKLLLGMKVGFRLQARSKGIRRLIEDLKNVLLLPVNILKKKKKNPPFREPKSAPVGRIIHNNRCRGLRNM